MEFLTTDAASAYMACCRHSLMLGVVGPHTFYSRMAALHKMCDETNPLRALADALLKSVEWNELPKWSDPPSEKQAIRASESEVTWDTEADEPSILRLVPGFHTGLQSWEFRKGDPDPYPSVPHGHFISNNKKKLDAYLGTIFLMGVASGRESRASIIALWNDQSFRAFAAEAIRHFAAGHPNWNWRVPDPYRLPGRRRP